MQKTANLFFARIVAVAYIISTIGAGIPRRIAVTIYVKEIYINYERVKFIEKVSVHKG